MGQCSPAQWASPTAPARPSPRRQAAGGRKPENRGRWPSGGREASPALGLRQTGLEPAAPAQCTELWVILDSKSLGSACVHPCSTTPSCCATPEIPCGRETDQTVLVAPNQFGDSFRQQALEFKAQRPLASWRTCAHAQPTFASARFASSCSSGEDSTCSPDPRARRALRALAGGGVAR